MHGNIFRFVTLYLTQPQSYMVLQYGESGCVEDPFSQIRSRAYCAYCSILKSHHMDWSNLCNVAFTSSPRHYWFTCTLSEAKLVNQSQDFLKNSATMILEHFKSHIYVWCYSQLLAITILWKGVNLKVCSITVWLLSYLFIIVKQLMLWLS